MKQHLHLVFKFNSNNKAKGWAQSGQGVVEYLLVLSVTIGIIVALKPAFSRMGVFTRSYMGDYISCLMNYGELPSLGVENSDLKKHKDEGSTCNAEFKDFTFAEGRPRTESAGTNRSDSNSSRNQDRANNRNENAGSSKSRTEANQVSDGNSVGSRSGRSSGRTSSGRVAQDGISQPRNSGKVSIIENDEGTSSSASRRSGAGRSAAENSNRSRNKYTAITGKLADEIQKNAPDTNKRKPSSRVISSKDESESKSKISRFSPPEKKPASVENESEEGWNFGSLIKWLIIIGIIIALLIFFGGQVMNYSNSES